MIGLKKCDKKNFKTFENSDCFHLILPDELILHITEKQHETFNKVEKKKKKKKKIP